MGRCHGDGQQRQHGGQRNDQIGAHQTDQHRLLHGHIHESQLSVQSIVLNEITKMVIADGAFCGSLRQTLAEDVLENVGILQIRIGTAGDVGCVPPDIHGEIGQQNLVAADFDGHTGRSPPAVVRRQHLLEHLAAEILNILPDSVVCGAEYRCKHQRNQRHAHRNELPAELSYHDKCLPLSKSLWKMLKKRWKSGKIHR